MTHAWLVVPPGASDDSDMPAVVRLPSSPTMPAALLSLGLDVTGISTVQASLQDNCPYAVGTSSTDWASGADFILVTPTIALATAAVTCGEMFVCEKTKQRCRGCVFIYAYSLPCLPAWCISRAALGGHRQSPVGSGGFNLSARAPAWRPTH